MLGLIAASLAFSPLKYRWVYCQTNFFRPEAVDETVALVHRAGKAGYNGILFCDSKLQSLSVFPDFYIKAIQRLKNAAEAEKMEIIPGILPVGYADGMLHLDPSLVESMPCRHVALKAQGGMLVSDPTELYVNGDFKSAQGDAVAGSAFQDGPGRSSFVDVQTEHGGNPSLRMENPGAVADAHGNCRLVQEVSLLPFHQYRFSFWAKSEKFERASEVRVIALDADGNNVSFQDPGVAATEDWTEHAVVFNSQSNRKLKLYLGVWGGTTGKLWLSSLSLKDAGFLNVDRRNLCPLVITDASGAKLSEGTDFASIADPLFGNVPYAGEFDFKHPLPSVSLPASSRIKDGDVVFADYYAATSTEQGKTSICLSDPKTAELEQNEFKRVDGLFNASGYLLSQDEMRVQGWCGACMATGKTSSQILSEDISRSMGYMGAKTPFVWSDMFDPFHNAVGHYYLVNGSLVDDWKGLPRNAVIVNWNSGHPDQSLGFFHKLGFSQILAGYYDGDVNAIKPWLATGETIGGINGVMYTTWVGDYKNLESFAKAAWGE